MLWRVAGSLCDWKWRREQRRWTAVTARWRCSGLRMPCGWTTRRGQGASPAAGHGRAGGTSLAPDLDSRRRGAPARFNAQATRAVTAGEDGTARIWDLQTFAAVGKPLVHPAAVLDASFGESDLLVTACADGSGRVWDIGRGVAVAYLNHEGPLTCARFDPAGRRILTASKDGSAKLYSSDGRLLATLKHSGPVNHAAFGAGGRLVVTASDDRTAAGSGRQTRHPGNASAAPRRSGGKRGALAGWHAGGDRRASISPRESGRCGTGPRLQNGLNTSCR